MKKFITIVMLITALNSYCPELSDGNRELKELNKANERELDYLFTVEFTEDHLRRLLILLDVGNVETVIKQSKLETGYYTSRLFKQYNNLFGMGLSAIRENHSNGYVRADGNRKVATYKTWQDSVKDFVAYLDYYKSLGYDTENYDKFLVDAGYCELGSYYIKLLSKIV